MSSKVTYRQQYTRCGKERCRKCKEGAGHGPYWYAYWSENGRTISKYVGLRLPEHIRIDRHVAEDEGKGEIKEETIIALTPQRPASEKVALSEKNMGLRSIQHMPLQLDSQVLRIYVLGQFRVDRLHGNEWSPVVNRTWHRRRARALLGCLLSNSGRRLGREQAMEALWPNLDLETAANRLNGAVHELRQILEPEIARPAASRMLRLERDVLELADRTHIWVDAEAFETLLKEVNTISIQGQGRIEGLLHQGGNASNAEQVERLLEEAAALYGGDYLLEELYSEWAAPRREVLKRGWIGLLLKLAELREARGALASAMEPLNRLLATDPTDETAVQRLMVLLTQLDRRGEALNTYRRLASRLQRNYESEPLPETQELYEKLRQGHIIKVSHPKDAGNGAAMDAAHISEGTADKPAVHPLNTPAEDTTRNTPEQQQPPQKSLAIEKSIGLAIAPFVGTGQLGRYNQSPLIGRSQELEKMHQVLLSFEGGGAAKAADNAPKEATNGHGATTGGARNGDRRKPHVLLLMGEAGIGKTRLAEELSHKAYEQGWAVAWTRAYEQEGTVPYRTWIELLRILLQHIPTELLVSSVGSRANQEMPNTIQYAPTTLERLSTLLPELRDLLPQSNRTYPQLPPEQERLHLWEATLGLLSMLSKTTPLLLVLDDLHWTDGSSRELLAYITRHIQDQRILLLGTCRDVELAPSHGLRTLIADLRREQTIMTIAVQPLTQSQIGSLVAHGYSLPQKIVESIQTQAAGNPFFAEELARVSEAAQSSAATNTEDDNKGTYSRTNAPHDTEGHSKSFVSSGLPEGIAAVLERRLGRLSNECQSLLGKAAVLGGSFEFNQLLFMAHEHHHEHHEDTILDLLEEALRAGLLTEEGTGARITYHFWHPLIVSHLYERLSAARCAQLHRRASQALLHAHQGHEGEIASAVTHHLIKGGSDPAQIARYAELAGSQAYSLSAYEEAEQYYIQAIKTITHDKLPRKEGESETGLQKQGSSFADIPNPLHVARLLERVCECEQVLGNYGEARLSYESILELRNQGRTFTTEAEIKREAQIQALIWREIGRTLVWNGYLDQAYECYQHGVQVMRDEGVTSGAAWACVHFEQGRICGLQGNNDEARRYAHEALEMLEQAMQDRQSQGVIQKASLEQAQNTRDSEVSIHQGPPFDSFQTRTERAIIGDPMEVGHVHELLGLIATNVGQFTEALQQFHKARAIFEQHDLVIDLAHVYGNLGAVHAVKSENAMAHTYMQRSLELAERMGNQPNIALVTGNLGEMATRSGELLQAEEWFRRSLAMAERIDDPDQRSWCNVALAGALQAQGNLAEAAKCIRYSLALARSMKNSLNIGAALVALADLRILQAVIACKWQERAKNTGNVTQPTPMCMHLLLRAKSTVQRALRIEGLETELVVEGMLILASIHFLLGDIEMARQQAMRTMQEARQYELTRMLARSHRLLGRILAAQGDYEEADAYFEQALHVFRECEMRLDYARTLHGYGVTLIERSTPGECLFQKGMASLQEARTIFVDCHAALDVDWVDHILMSSQSEYVVQ